VPNSYVASADGLDGIGDEYHFSRDSYLKLGARFAVQMMQGIHKYEQTGVAQKQSYHVISGTPVTSSLNNILVYTLRGQIVFSGPTTLWQASNFIKSGNVFIVNNMAIDATENHVAIQTVR
jgi:hypothetical protein